MSNTFATPWTVGQQAVLSMGFPRQEYWSGLHFLLQEIFLTQGLNPNLLHWQVDSLQFSNLGNPGIRLEWLNVEFLYHCQYFFVVKTYKIAINYI